MDQTLPKRGFRFGLRRLLALVAVCAVVSLIFSWLPHTVTSSELLRVNLGMTKDEVRQLLGEPTAILQIKEPRAPENLDEAWYYSRGLTYLDAPPAVGFSNGRVVYNAALPRP